MTLNYLSDLVQNIVVFLFFMGFVNVCFKTIRLEVFAELN